MIFNSNKWYNKKKGLSNLKTMSLPLVQQDSGLPPMPNLINLNGLTGILIPLRLDMT